MGTIDPNPFENLLAVQVYAPKSWVASAHLNGRAATELFPLDGGVSTTVCTVEGFARHVAEKLYTLGVLSLEEFYDVSVRTDWKISYVLSWANRFGIEVKLCPILAIMPPVSAGATGAQRARSVFDSILEAVPAPGYAQLIERVQTHVRAHLGDDHVRYVLHHEGFALQEPSSLSCGYLMGEVLEG